MEIDVHRVARLARLALTDEEARTYGEQLQSILAYVDQLAELDTEGVEPTRHVMPLDAPLRPDEVEGVLDRDAALANAPDTDGEAFAVPRVV